MDPIKVFYDGNCGACRFEINIYKKLKTKTPIEWLDIAKNPSALNHISLSYQDAMKSFYVLDQNNTLQNGVDAFCIIWTTIPWLAWVPRLVKLPLVYQSCWIVYTIFAYLRFRWHGYHKCKYPK